MFPPHPHPLLNIHRQVADFNLSKIVEDGPARPHSSAMADMNPRWAVRPPASLA
jgi:hypothetical protein